MEIRIPLENLAVRKLSSQVQSTEVVLRNDPAFGGIQIDLIGFDGNVLAQVCAEESADGFFNENGEMLDNDRVRR